MANDFTQNRHREPLEEYGDSDDLCVVGVIDNAPAGSSSVQTTYLCLVIDPIVDESEAANVTWESTGREILVLNVGARRPPISEITGDPASDSVVPIVALQIGDRWIMQY